MSVVIAGSFVIVTFLLAAVVIFNTVLGTTSTQGASLREASDLRMSQVGGNISISSTSTGDTGGGTTITIAVDNPGAISYIGDSFNGDFSRMDLLVDYTNTTGGQEVRRLTYVCKELCSTAGGPSANRWTITGLSPDTFNPKIWDPDETVTISSTIAPAVKTGVPGKVVVVVPDGVSDSAFFNN